MTPLALAKGHQRVTTYTGNGRTQPHLPQLANPSEAIQSLQTSTWNHSNILYLRNNHLGWVHGLPYTLLRGGLGDEAIVA